MTKRVTIISATAGRSNEWNDSFEGSEVLHVAEFANLAARLRQALNEDGDVERVVIDSVAPALFCLEFLCQLPHCFTGDVLFISDEGRSFLSATGRGGDRLLYHLEQHDVDFYRAATSRSAPEVSAPEKSAPRLVRYEEVCGTDAAGFLPEASVAATRLGHVA